MAGQFDAIHNEIHPIRAGLELNQRFEADFVAEFDTLDLVAGHTDLEILVAWLHEGEIVFAFVAAVDVGHKGVRDSNPIGHKEPPFYKICSYIIGVNWPNAEHMFYKHSIRHSANNVKGETHGS